MEHHAFIYQHNHHVSIFVGFAVLIVLSYIGYQVRNHFKEKKNKAAKK